MNDYKTSYEVKCWNDCVPQGCPKHLVTIEANNTSNALAYYKDGKAEFGMDFDELDGFVQHLQEITFWIEIERMFKPKEQTKGATQMTQPNQSELYQALTDICFENGGVTKTMADKLAAYITANYTPNDRLEDLLIDFAVAVTRSRGFPSDPEQFYEHDGGRKLVKETLAELTKE